MDEIRLAYRRLAKHPAATVVSVVTLACAIGAASATWSLLSAVLLRPLPVHDPDRLFVVGSPVTSGRRAGTFDTGFVYPYYPFLRDSGVFDRVAAVWQPAMRLIVDGDTGRANAYVSFVSHDYFDTLGVNVQRGRPFSASDDREDGVAVGIVSDRYWRRAFGADEGLVGRTLLVNHRPVAIVGVAAAGFRGISLAQTPDIFVPFHVIADVGGPPTNYFARPNAGMSPTAGVVLIGRSSLPQSQLNARLAGLPPASPGQTTRLMTSPIDVEAVPQMTRAGMTRFARILVATVALLLLAGCLTVGTLLLVRTEARQDEFAMCLALGASRRRLAAGVGLEGAILSAAGAALAVPVALGLFGAMRGFQLPGGVSIEALGLALDLRVVAAAAAAALIAMALLTTVAAVSGFRADVADAIRSRTGTTRIGRRRARTVLVAGQVAVALALAAGAGVFTRTLAAGLSLNAGFEPGRVVTGVVSLSQYGYTATRASDFYERLSARLGAVPSIARLSLSQQQGGMSGALAINGVPRQFPTQVEFTAIDDRYFATIGLRLLSGRDFAPTDNHNAPPVGIVSESYGRLLAGGSSPLGMRIGMPNHPVNRPPAQVEIVGVVPDVISQITVVEPLVLYLALAQQEAGTSRELIARTDADPAVAMRDITAAIREIDKTLVPPTLTTMQDALGRQMNAQRFGAVVLGALGGIAVLLTLLGTYVLAESMAVMRTREMGVRAALGATRRQLATLMLRETARLVTIGLAAGLFLAWAGTGTIQSFMFRVAPLDPLTLATVSAGILMLSLTVTLRPALRASHLDLAAVLKAE